MGNFKLKEKEQFVKDLIRNLLKENNKLFLSSSFQTHSIPLIHLVSRVDKEIPVFFLNTGFHFPETYKYIETIENLLQIEVNHLKSKISKSNQRDTDGRFFFCSNTDLCCQINKIEPLIPIMQKNDIWISGVRRDQNANRARLKMFEKAGSNEVIRFHPFIDWNSKMIFSYRKKYNLPPHPLEEQGYLSIGCEPCTERVIGNDRNGRWKGQSKTECGLHTELVDK